MKLLRFLIPVMSFLSFAGCATTGTDGIVQIGPDTYMVGGLGKFTDFSGSAVKARLIKQAQDFCKSKGRVMLLLNSSAKDSGVGTYASAEIQFLCLDPEDPRVAEIKPTL